MNKEIFGKVDLFVPLLGDVEAIIPCSFDFDLEKKKLPTCPYSKKCCGGQPNNYFFLGLKEGHHLDLAKRKGKKKEDGGKNEHTVIAWAGIEP